MVAGRWYRILYFPKSALTRATAPFRFKEFHESQGESRSHAVFPFQEPRLPFKASGRLLQPKPWVKEPNVIFDAQTSNPLLVLLLTISYLVCLTELGKKNRADERNIAKCVRTYIILHDPTEAADCREDASFTLSIRSVSSISYISARNAPSS